MVKLFFSYQFLLLSLNGFSQSVQFETKFSEPFAVFQFINSLSGNSPGNVYKKLFQQSGFSTKASQDLIKVFDSLNIDYSFDFTDYPPGQKVGIDVPNLLRRNLILSNNMQDFKIRSMGLLPNEKLMKLIAVINQFTSVYETVIYEPYKARFEKQLEGLSNVMKTSNINSYFAQALLFYNSSWDVTIPFVFAFYPLPNSRGFTATAVSNVAISAIADSLENYKALLSVMLHEMCHVAYDERSLHVWNQMQEWFDSNSSKISGYANSLFNEAMATAVGNGYLGAQLNGKEDTTHSWYGVKYINLMARAAYPLVKEYIQAGKHLDREFVDRYIHLFEERFPNWLYDPQYVMRGRLLITDRAEDADVLRSIFEPAPGNENEKEISEPILKKIILNHGTKVIIVNTNNKEELKLIKNYVPELQSWQYTAKKDFTYTRFLNNKSWLIILNNVSAATRQKLENLVMKE